MIGFNEHLLVERAKDAEMGAAAKKSFLLARKFVVATISDSLKEWWNTYSIGAKTDRSVEAIRFEGSLYGGEMWQADTDKTPNEVFKEKMGYYLYIGLKGILRKRIGVGVGDLAFSFGVSDTDEKGSIDVFAAGPEGNRILVLPSAAVMGGMDYEKAYQKMSWTGVEIRLVPTMEKAGGTFAQPWFDTKATIKVGGVETMFTRTDLFNLLISTRKKGRTKAYQDFDTFARNIGAFMEKKLPTYIHEYIHLLDYLRRTVWMTKRETEGTKAFWSGEDINLYYTNELEINAYFQTAATMAREGVRNLLVALTSDGMAVHAMKEFARSQGMPLDLVEKSFNHPQGATLRDGIMARGIEGEYRRIMEKAKNEEFDSHKALAWGINKASLTPSMILVLMFLWETTNAPTAWRKDERVWKKILTRIYSVAGEIDKIANDYIAGVKGGKYPSKQAWNKSVEMMRWGKYSLLYSGILMKSMSREPFDPKKTYPLGVAKMKPPSALDVTATKE